MKSKKAKKQGSSQSENRVVLVIPARLASTRLPEKPLILLAGKPMIQWTWELACQVRGVSQVVVATDHEKVASVIRGLGGTVHLSSSDLSTGTERVAAVAQDFPAEIYINLQGDEPAMRPESIEKALELVRCGRFSMSTLASPFSSNTDFQDFGCVKVILDRYQRALYFSRYPIPYSRQQPPADITEGVAFKHSGIYVFQRKTLLELQQLPPSPLEKAESLEQLRALERGIAIGVALFNHPSIEVNTPEEAARAGQMLCQKEKSDV